MCSYFGVVLRVEPLLPPECTALLRLALHAPLKQVTVQGVKGEEGNGEAASPAPLPETVRCLAAAWRCASATTASGHGAALADTLALALNPGTCLGLLGVCSVILLMHAHVCLLACIYAARLR